MLGFPLKSLWVKNNKPLENKFKKEMNLAGNDIKKEDKHTF